MTLLAEQNTHHLHLAMMKLMKLLTLALLCGAGAAINTLRGDVGPSCQRPQKTSFEAATTAYTKTVAAEKLPISHPNYKPPSAIGRARGVMRSAESTFKSCCTERSTAALKATGC